MIHSEGNVIIQYQNLVKGLLVIFSLKSILILFWNLFLGTSLNTSTRKEIGKLRRTNKVFQQIKSPLLLQIFLFFVNNWWIFLGLSILSLCLGPEIFKHVQDFTNLSPLYTIPACFWNSDYGFKDLYGVLAGIQATLFGIFIPVTIAVFSLLFKNSEVKDDILEALNVQTALKGLVLSSAFLLAWTTILFFLYQTHFAKFLNFLVGLSTLCWFIINVSGLLRFTIVGLNFISPSKRNEYLKKHIVNEIYPQEIHLSLKEYRYLTLEELTDE